MYRNLKQKAMAATIWSGLETYGVLSMVFLINVILARLLSPDDYGTIGLLLLFIALSRVFIDGGFSSAIIQRKNITQVDLSTVFFWNLSVSLILVIILYFSAPAIANFYNIPLLKDLLRVQSISLIIGAFSLVQISKLTKELKFKTLAMPSMISTVIGAMVGISMAYSGYGVWSLVGKELATRILHVTILWLITRWKPSLIFSWRSFRSLFSFSFKITLTTFTFTLYDNIQTLIIGKVFSVGQLGYYIQAKKLETTSAQSLSSTVGRVTFPLYSSISDDLEGMKYVVRKTLKVISFIIFPMMTLLIIIAQPLIVFLFSDKWIAAVPFFQILCVTGICTVLAQGNMQIFKALGKSGLLFKIQIVMRSVALILILFSIKYGIWALMWCIALNSILFYTIHIYYTQKYFIYSAKEQLQDIVPALFTSLIAGILSHILIVYIAEFSNFLQILLTSLSFACIYFALAYILKIDILNYLLSTVFKLKLKEKC